MSLEISRLRALCFDVDGTLRDTDDQYVQRLSGWLRPWRFLLPARDPGRAARWLIMASEDPGRLLHGLPDRLGIDDELSRLGNWWYQHGPARRPEDFLLIEGVAELLHSLKTHYPLAVVTARGERATLAFLDRFGLRCCFHCIASAQTCKHTKPYPDPVLWAAEQMGVPPETCLMVGDTVVDIQAGKAAGAQTVGVLCGFGERQELERAGADLILPTTAELGRILLQGETN